MLSYFSLQFKDHEKKVLANIWRTATNYTKIYFEPVITIDQKQKRETYFSKNFIEVTKNE